MQYYWKVLETGKWHGRVNGRLEEQPLDMNKVPSRHRKILLLVDASGIMYDEGRERESEELSEKLSKFGEKVYIFKSWPEVTIQKEVGLLKKVG